jgi:hypothetical protein
MLFLFISSITRKLEWPSFMVFSDVELGALASAAAHAQDKFLLHAVSLVTSVEEDVISICLVVDIKIRIQSVSRHTASRT